MQTLFKTLFKCIRRSPSGQDEDRDRFLAKTENFRLLLAANNKALEGMAQATEDAQSSAVFSMAHVRAQCLMIASNVRQMIERLCLMAPGRYDALRDVFNARVLAMEKAMDEGALVDDGPLVLEMEDICADSVPQTGAKMAMLGEVRAALGVEVPRGFSITAASFGRIMEQTGLGDEINRLIQIHDSDTLDGLRLLEESIRHAIDMTVIPQDIEQAVKKSCQIFGKVRLAVRSSAIGEDSEDASFAGQFASKLGVKADDVLEAYRRVVASAYSSTAMSYRLNRGLRDDAVIMCVACMEMINAKAGGVVYTRSPMGRHDRQVLVNAVPGLPSAVVDGSSLVDSWVVDRESLTILDRHIAVKDVCHGVATNGRIIRERLSGERSGAPSVDDTFVKELVQQALRIERYFTHPQDIEWALADDGRLVFLQCRPLAVCEPHDEVPSEMERTEDAGAILFDACDVASPGVAGGPVFPVAADEDMSQFPDGGVVVSRSARPQLSVLMAHASALVTDYGSSVGHLANVAREFGIPYLIAGPGAFEQLSGVGVVTVNAMNGTISLGLRQSQLDAAVTTDSVVLGNDVRMALQRVLPCLVPLSLTDPESPDFVPENCVSLHDITRFCHEKAVNEMFMGGERLTSNARKLVGKTPTQYWLIDIGGGTVETADTARVTLNDIRSNAMQAVWRGMTAIPWDGPPPVAAGGLMAVLSEAASNPALTPGMANSMGERNYFIVGRQYCNLQSRFGFHFCTIEGFAGDDPTENYALFQFKGGGADMARRSRRTAMIGTLLERHGFIVEIRDDALFARIEGVEADAVEQALVVAGYLLVHTRQVDMVCADIASIDRYKQKFSTDINALLSGKMTDIHDWRCGA
ncbi:pyruvate, water dikinase [Pseudodesulfovibrio sp. JC047]|uniref:PEP/pyruvate-binding domain-containing protein n=1 Tax=Pseudodesulfovibrio sp. JC047 TaxID=2683199 RepID=UPI0013D3D93C|nr:PEP/pyruvate-binding domain-containing protein [Pseudodesulfovibrio sp. JC047]NDV19860.1 pyruvate, water dikinase [Pseudodesulfovibrio sp. JC047]